MSAGAPSKWERHVQYRRSVMCPKSCGHEATETREIGSYRVTGVCTECGHLWSRAYEPYERTEP